MFSYIIYFICLATLFFEGGALFDKAFGLFGVAEGGRTIAVQGIAVVAVASIVLGTGVRRTMQSDLLRLLLVWLPWLIYLYLRSDFDDPYSVKKLWRIVGLQFTSLIILILAYRASPDKFNKYFLPVTAVMSVILLATFLLSPTLFYTVSSERLTLENVSPVWLARSFAVTAVWLFITTRIPLVIRVSAVGVLTAAIVLTGSRGPLLSMLIVLGLYVAATQYRRPNFGIKAVGLMFFAVVVVGVAMPIVESGLEGFFTRGQSRPILEQSGRSTLWTLALDDFQSAPTIGVGLGGYLKQTSGSSKSIGQVGRNRDFVRVYPHNIALEVLAELGLIGFVIFMFVIQPGRWMRNLQSPYHYLFWLSFLFAMTSGDLPANSGVFIFALLARMAHGQAQLAQRSKH